MTTYKEEQGRLARMFAFWAVAFMILFGCNWLHGMLVRASSLREPIAGLRIPVAGVDVNIAFLISFALFVLGMVWLVRWSKKEKIVDLLADTEAELRKVTWPTTQEVVNSSIVVIVFVLVLLGFLAGADVVLGRVITYLIFGAV
ncbi:MAG: preprotein translocase subunit SecE [Planctomycetota bacterium]